MTRRGLNLLTLCLSVTYLIAPLVAFSAARYLRFATDYFANKNEDPSSYFLWMIIVLPIWALIVQQFRLNRPETIISFDTGVGALAKAVFWMITIVLSLFFFYRPTQFSRIFAVTGCVLTFLLSLGALHIFRAVLLSKRGPFRWRIRMAILGVEGYETRLAKYLESISPIPAEIACTIPLDRLDTTVYKWPVLDYLQITDVVDVYHCQEVLVALPPNRLGELQLLLQPLRNLCVPVRVVLDMGDGVFIPDRIFNFYGLPLLDVRPYPVDTLSYVVGKRFFDIIFSIATLIFVSPLAAIISIAIKLTSPGPVFFLQERISLNGKQFKMLKFRTMHLQESGLCDKQHTSRNDHRITRLGRLLRRTSLDELPQFLNVLRGEMSVVGPRPELTFFVQKFRQEIPVYMARHNVKCGITGLAQVNGFRGSDTSIQKRIEQDLHYMQNWSLLLDLNIIFKTVFNGLGDKNAF
jgi:Undecaprenyl-phosphate glucose phosphotransferase